MRWRRRSRTQALSRSLPLARIAEAGRTRRAARRLVVVRSADRGVCRLPDRRLRARVSRRVVASQKTHGRTASGKPITDELVKELADKAESGYDVDETIRRRSGRPPIGSAAASVESVRLDPELRQALAKRAEQDHETTSSVIRKALRRYLQVG